MGYITNYTVIIDGFADADAAELFFFKEFWKSDAPLRDLHTYATIGKHTGTINLEMQMKWYNWEKDLVALSLRWPAVRIEVEGRGEENGDQWKARVQNGASETVQAQLTFPDFKKIIY